MELNIQSIQFDADKKLVEFVEEKVTKLSKYNDKIIGGDVYLRLEKNEIKENKVAEIKLRVPGKELFAKKHCNSFEEAVTESVEALKRQINKQK